MNKKGGIAGWYVDFVIYFIFFWVILFFYIAISSSEYHEKIVKVGASFEELSRVDKILILNAVLSSPFGAGTVADKVAVFPEKAEHDNFNFLLAEIIDNYVNEIVRIPVEAGRLPCHVFFRVQGGETGKIYYSGLGYRDFEAVSAKISLPSGGEEQYVFFGLDINCPEAQR